MNGLQKRRMELGLSQPQVSEILKAADPRVDVAMVSRFERGVCLPTENVLKLLETALQADRSVLLSEDDLAAMPGGEDEQRPEYTKLTQTLALLIPFGKENAISREALAAKLFVGDRTARRAVEDARNEGLVIINDGTGRGYYQTTDLEEIYHQYQQDTARAMSILKRRKTIRRILKEAGRDV